MTQEFNETKDLKARDESQKEFVQDMDSGSKALSEALRLSFAILKFIMIILVILFFASGIFSVEKNERALILRFGRVLTDATGPRLLEPGLHWAFPYPIDEIVVIPVSGTRKLELNSFWYFDPPQARGRVPDTLNPIQDGYSLTRNDPIDGFESDDYNIVHSRWQLNYTIEQDPYAFFRNVKVRSVRPGELYSDVISESIEPLLRSVCDNAIISTLVEYNIDEATTTARTMIAAEVRRRVQQKLDKLETGIAVRDMQVLALTWPRQVNDAFQASIRASQARERIETEAWSYYERALNEAAGPYAEDIYRAIMDPDTPEDEMEMLWERLAGEGRAKLAEARAYRTTMVEKARSNAEYLQAILPEFRARPELVIQKIYQDAIEEVLAGADEKIIVQPYKGEKGREFRVMINRDPDIKDKQNNEN